MDRYLLCRAVYWLFRFSCCSACGVAIQLFYPEKNCTTWHLLWSYNSIESLKLTCQHSVVCSLYIHMRPCQGKPWQSEKYKRKEMSIYFCVLMSPINILLINIYTHTIQVLDFSPMKESLRTFVKVLIRKGTCSLFRPSERIHSFGRQNTMFVQNMTLGSF